MACAIEIANRKFFMPLPYLTHDIPGIGGTIKNRAEDFFVQELPLYEPSGQGEHVYAEFQKIGLSTFDAIDRIGRALYVSSRDIGYAGLKDARAITRQIFSIPNTTEEAVMKLKLPSIEPLWAARHGNKLRLGHLAGNRFAIKVRDVIATDVVKLSPLVEILKTRGMPNYFGEQRFGRRGDNHLLGAALVRGDDEALLKLLLGMPKDEVDDSQAMGARKAFDRGDFQQAMKLFPRSSGMERRILHRLIKTGDAKSAVRAIDQKLQRLWISALQSELFNQVAAKRIDSIDRLIDGDLAWKHENGACFAVESADVEQPRAANFEISPTGPLLGYRMTLPAGKALEIEENVFKAYELSPGDFRVEGRLRVKGARRPLRVQPKDVELAAGVDEFGPHITFAFTLPPGSFATVFLRECMKNDD
jgi:tRNA pseudouridine13 synthase